jgi:hypothetical protein
VSVALGQGTFQPIEMKVLTYNLKIDTNLKSGEVLYAPTTGQTGNGANIQAKEAGNYCVVKVKTNGEAEVSGLKRGYYLIDIRPGDDDLQFEDLRTGLHVPEDIDKTGGQPIQVDLDERLSSEKFSANAWSDSDWAKPTDWKIDKGMKARSTEGIALPVNDRYRHYVDFELITNIKLNDQGSAGFVLRAKDPSNYYALFISGPKSADAPNTARLFIVKDGVRKYASSLPINVFSEAISSDKGFSVRIVGDRTGFVLFIEDTDGKLHQAGKLVDDLNTYRIGAIGIAALDKPDFDVRQFQVCTPKCQQ